MDKKTSYALSGTFMIISAVALRVIAGGGGEVVLLLGVGMMTLLASAEGGRRGEA